MCVVIDYTWLCPSARVCVCVFVCVYSFIYVLHVFLCTHSCLTFSSAPPTQSERLIVKEQTGVQKFGVLDVKGGTTLRLNQHRPTKRGLLMTSRLFTAALRLYEVEPIRSHCARPNISLWKPTESKRCLISTLSKRFWSFVFGWSYLNCHFLISIKSGIIWYLESLFGPFVRITQWWDDQHIREVGEVPTIGWDHPTSTFHYWGSLISSVD